ncbi:RNA methyltransferase [Nocardioides sp. HDW12B]|uniref:TrmH family RNA methyltransferase n=1 Tax=Nocardioides sp. HDW12B TaxID=2714939 RepID=UPI00140757EC|nr:RNA methyltransferase [Nocardioides sp. HDW12B]QIK66581.1 RNA methyltransferase [Nocardioides sp. HDW12B]
MSEQAEPTGFSGPTGGTGPTGATGPTGLTVRSGRVRTARKLLRRAGRREAGLFLAEGPQAVREALAGGHVREVFARPDAQPELRSVAGQTGLPWYDVDEAVLAELTDTVHPQGVVAVCRVLDVPVGEAVRPGVRLAAVLADVRDPGNAGTVLRCADAAGAEAVVLAGHSVDLYNPKTVRASVGSLFHLPVAAGASPAATVDEVRRAGLTVLAADGAGELDLFEAEASGLLAAPTAWLFGNEAWGLPEEVAALADHRVRIPIFGGAESLNLATAAAVCLYTSARVQRAPRP